MTSSVIGLDLGSSSAYVAKVENGGVVLLTNEINSRCTPTILSLPSSERGTRMVGASAESQLVTHPNSSVSELIGLLGASMIDLRSHRDFAKLETHPSNPTKMGIKLTYNGQVRTFLPEQLVATVLKQLKKIVTEDAENKINGQNNFYVLSVPNYFTDIERHALLDAARIAQINVIHLTNDITAAALAYGYFQKNLPNAVLPGNEPNHTVPVADLRISAPPIAERPRLVIFVDFGHSGLQTGLVAFSSEGLKVMTTQTDRTIGGRDFDARLAKHFMDLFNLQHRSKGIRLRPETHPKVYAKLLSVAEKMKRQMSANRNVLPVVVECLCEDLDLNTEISRDVFEQLCSDLFEKIRNCFVRLLQRARIEHGGLHSVEILGGSSRIPMFKQIVEDIFRIAPSTTLNADEAVARGCALMCALNTKVFKVKPFLVLDTVHYNTQVKYSCVVPEGGAYSLVPAYNNSSHASPALHTQTKRVFQKNSKAGTSMMSYLELEDLPHGHTLALEYCVDDEEEGQRDCDDVRSLTKPLIAIYNFEHDVAPREGDKLQLEFSHESGGIVRLKTARLVHTAKRVKYDDTNVRERNVRFSEIRVGGLTEKEVQVLMEEENRMEDCDTKERIREETKNRLEEFTFALRDELDNLEEDVQKEEAWAIVAKYVRNLSAHFESEQYENSSVEFYRQQLDEAQKKKTVFMVWLTRFNQKREFEKVRNGMVHRR